MAKVDNKSDFVQNAHGILQFFYKQGTDPYTHNPVDPSELFQRSIQTFQSGKNSCIPTISLTETGQPADPRAKNPRFDASKKGNSKGFGLVAPCNW